MNIQEQVKLLRADKRIKRIEYTENDKKVSFYTNSLDVTSPDKKETVYLGDFYIEFKFAAYGIRDLKVKNLTNRKGAAETPFIYSNSRGFSNACWAGHGVALDSAGQKKDLVQVVELLLHFMQTTEGDTTGTHSVNLWFGKKYQKQISSAEWNRQIYNPPKVE